MLEKDNNYFSDIRWDIISLIPQGSHKILEVGCGSGNTCKTLKQENKAAEVVGIEIVEHVAEHGIFVGNLDDYFGRRRFGNVPVRLVLYRLDDSRGRVVRSHDNHAWRRLHVTEFLEYVESIHLGQADVEQDQMKLFRRHATNSGQAIADSVRVDAAVAKHVHQDAIQSAVVIDNENSSSDRFCSGHDRSSW
jgi:SAM-dependent methyltransferase